MSVDAEGKPTPNLFLGIATALMCALAAGAVWCVLASLVASLAQRPAGRGEASALD